MEVNGCRQNESVIMGYGLVFFILIVNLSVNIYSGHLRLGWVCFCISISAMEVNGCRQIESVIMGYGLVFLF